MVLPQAPPTISTKSGCLVKNGPVRGLGALRRWSDILDTRWPLRLSPAQPPNQGSGKSDPILVPNLVWLLVTLYNPLHLCASGPTGSLAFPAFPLPAPDVGVSMWSCSPRGPLPSQEGKQEGSLYPVFTLTRFDSMLEAALLICIVGLAGRHCWVHEVLSGGPVVQAEPQA